MRTSARGLLVSVAVAVAAPTAGAAQAAPHAALLEAAGKCQPRALALLKTLVAMDSGTADAAGVGAVGQVIAGELRGLGAKVERVPSAAPGFSDSLVATLEGKGKGRILLVPHMDTVFAKGTAGGRPPAEKGDKLVGPGAGDDKNGIAAAVCALAALQAVGFTDFQRITVVVNSNEETGSFGSRDLFKEKARGSDVALVLEGGADPDAVKIMRKGSGTIALEIEGRAAHAGVEPEKGRNALLEAAQQALRLGALADPAKKTTVNATVLHAGSVSNVIADHATVLADVRVQEPDEFDRVERDLQRQVAQTTIPDVKVKASLTRNFPPFPHLASTDLLAERARRFYGELGRTLGAVAVGGAGDIGFVAETGTPALDGLGFVAGAAHGIDDYAVISSITPRVYLLARLIMELGHEPPQRLPQR